LSDTMPTKKDVKRMSLNPNAKLNVSVSNKKQNESTLSETDQLASSDSDDEETMVGFMDGINGVIEGTFDEDGFVARGLSDEEEVTDDEEEGTDNEVEQVADEEDEEIEYEEVEYGDIEDEEQEFQYGDYVDYEDYEGYQDYQDYEDYSDLEISDQENSDQEHIGQEGTYQANNDPDDSDPEEENKSQLIERDPFGGEQNANDDVTEQLSNMDAEPNRTVATKRLSGTILKKPDMKRMSLHPDAKLNVGGSSKLDFGKEKSKSTATVKDNQSAISKSPNKNRLNDIKKPDRANDPTKPIPSTSKAQPVAGASKTESISSTSQGEPVPSTSQGEPTPSTSRAALYELNIDAIQARCDAFLNSENEAKQSGKKNKKAMKKEKLEKLKEKKAAKLKEKKGKSNQTITKRSHRGRTT